MRAGSSPIFPGSLRPHGQVKTGRDKRKKGRRDMEMEKAVNREMKWVQRQPGVGDGGVGAGRKR